MLSLILKFYALGAAVVAARLLLCLLLEFDKYDRRYVSEETWFCFFFSCLLWPLLLFHPMTSFVKPRESLLGAEAWIDGEGIGGWWTWADRDRLRDNLPPCGPKIRYIATELMYGPSVKGRFLFDATDVETHLRSRLVESPELQRFDEGDIYQWTRQRDNSLTGYTDVPDLWDRYCYVALELLKNGSGKAYCPECDTESDAGVLDIGEEFGLTGRMGWSYYYVKCPGGHTLLQADGTRSRLS